MSQATSPRSTTGRFLSVVSQLWRLGGWLPAAVFILHVVLHEVFDAYSAAPALDVPMHLVGGLAIAFAAYRVFDWLWSPAGTRAPAAVRHVFALGLTSLAAVFWEFAEFLTDRYLGTRVQTGLNDTLVDMAMGLAGGIGYLAWRALRSRAPSPEEPEPQESARAASERPMGDPV